MDSQEIKLAAEQAGLYAKIKNYGHVHIYHPKYYREGYINHPLIVIDDLCQASEMAVLDASPWVNLRFWRSGYIKRNAFSYGTQDGRCFNAAIRKIENHKKKWGC